MHSDAIDSTPQLGLQGKVALVTGCGRHEGIGRATALALARHRAYVAVTDLMADGVRNMGESGECDRAWGGIASVVEEIERVGGQAIAFTGDVSVEADADRLVTEATSRFGRVDVLVNNAAAPQGADRGPSWLIPIEAYDKVMAVNARSAFLMSRAVVRHLLSRLEAGEGIEGRVINIASGAGKRGFPERAAYCASKFAIVGTQTLAQELGDKSITVNAVCPGWIQTSRAVAREARGDNQTKRGVFAPAIPEQARQQRWRSWWLTWIPRQPVTSQANRC